MKILLQKLLSIFCIGGLVLAFATISSSSPGMAQQASSPAQEQAKPQSNTADLPPLPSSPIEKAEKDGTASHMSLKDLTKLALQNNLDIAIQDTNEQISQQKIIQQYGAYDPTLTASLNTGSQKTANTNLATMSTQGSFSKQDTANWNLQFSQAVKTGGTIQANWNSRRSDNNQSFSLFTPQYSGSTTVSFTQPLRRNFRIDQNRANIKLVNLDLQTSDSKFKQKVLETIANIQSQYWDLVSAIRDYDIKRNSVQLAQISLRDNRKKVEVGTLAPINITEAEATLAQREVDLISSEERILSQENTMRALISNNRNSEIWTQVIVPTETPDFKEYKVELGTAITTALAKRPELEQNDIALKQSDINEGLLRNNKKWQFDLTASFGSTGVSGPQSYKSGVPQTPDELIGGLFNAYKTVFTEGFTNWQVGFQVQIPLRSRSLDSQLAQQQIQKRQTLMQRKNTEQSIQVDVRNAVQRLETNKKQVETTGVGRKAAQAQLEGEVKRFDAGLSQNYLVLQRQNDLSQAEYNELQALINYKKAIINLQKVMYTLLESNDFEIAKGSSSNVPDLK
jgi:outer membrane protein